jgi:hypothetical protein
MSTLGLIDTDLDQQLDDKDDESFAHYAESASVTEGYVMGTPVQAICGKIFVPSKNPERLRLCPICKEIMDALFLSEE